MQSSANYCIFILRQKYFYVCNLFFDGKHHLLQSTCSNVPISLSSSRDHFTRALRIAWNDHKCAETKMPWRTWGRIAMQRCIDSDGRGSETISLSSGLRGSEYCNTNWICIAGCF